MDIRKNNEDKVKKFIAKVLKNKAHDVYASDGKPSPSKLLKRLKAETGITITRQTMAKYLKDDLSSYLVGLDFSKNSKIGEITNAMSIAKEIYENEASRPGDKTRAMNSWRQLNQQLIDYEQHLREIEIRKVEAGRPNYLVQFNPACAEYTCSKCKHSVFLEWDAKSSKWVDVDDKEKKEEKVFKAGEGQGTIYDNEK